MFFLVASAQAQPVAVTLPVGGSILAQQLNLDELRVAPGGDSARSLFPMEDGNWYVAGKKGGNVFVWATSEGWYRITPNGVDPELWTWHKNLRLGQGMEQVSEDASYLESFYEAQRRYVEEATVRACGVLVDKKPIEDEPFHARRLELRIRLKEGNIYPLYGIRQGQVQYRRGPARYWIDKRVFDLAASFSDKDNPCVYAYSPKANPPYRFIASSAYRSGPSNDLPPVDFYEEGQIVRVQKKYPGSDKHPEGWLMTDVSGIGEVWFDASHAMPFSFPMTGYTIGSLNLRAGRSNKHKVLYVFSDVESYLGLFAFKEGWYRVTPRGFRPEGWVLSQRVRVVADPPKKTAFNYYLTAIEPPPPPPPPPPTPPPAEPPPKVELEPRKPIVIEEPLKEGPVLSSRILFGLYIIAAFAAIVAIRFLYTLLKPRENPRAYDGTISSRPSLSEGAEGEDDDMLEAVVVGENGGALESRGVIELTQRKQHASIIDQVASDRRDLMDRRSQTKLTRADKEHVKEHRELEEELDKGEEARDRRILRVQTRMQRLTLEKLKLEREIAIEEQKLVEIREPVREEPPEIPREPTFAELVGHDKARREEVDRVLAEEERREKQLHPNDPDRVAHRMAVLRGKAEEYLARKR